MPETPPEFAALRTKEYELTDKKLWPQLTAVACGAALMALAGCGGGGGGVAAPADIGALSAQTDSPSTPSTPSPQAFTGSPIVGDCEMFPANAIFNTRIDDTSRFPKAAKSDDWINLIGRDTPFTTNWSSSDNPADRGGYFGIPFNVVDGTPATTSWPVVSFNFSTSGQSSNTGYPDKSDCAVDDGHGGFSIGRGCGSTPEAQRRFPFPVNALNEGGTCNDPNSCGDHHVLVVEKGACRLWESWFSYNLSGQWYSMATAAWDLKSNALRPFNWASADAAGLPITPLLAKAPEASSGEIRHAMRVTFNGSKLAPQASWPGRFASDGSNPAGAPFGALLRLRSDFVIPNDWTPQAKAVATAAKRYGLYVADNGPDFYVQGEPNKAWDMANFNQMHGIKLSDMEFVDLKAITGDPRFSPDSMAASW
jgi:hypothetical protein